MKSLLHPLRRSVVAGGVAAGLLVAGGAASQLMPPLRDVAAQPAGGASLSRQSFVAEAVQRSGPAVVTLETARTVQGPSVSGLPQGLLRDPMFRQFFGLPGGMSPQSRVQRGQGSGVLFAEEGLLLTNAHVVGNESRVEVELVVHRLVAVMVLVDGQLSATA